MTIKSQKQLRQKLRYTYTLIILTIVLSLTVYFITAIKGRIRQTNLEFMNIMTDKAVTYLAKSAETVEHINNDLYETDMVLADLIKYLKGSDEEYRKYRLDTFMGTVTLSYMGIDDFVQKVLKANLEITKIEFVSYENDTVTVWYRSGGSLKKMQTTEGEQKIRTGNLAEKGSFSFLKEIREPPKLQNIGCMIITFNGERFATIKEAYDKVGLLVVNAFGTVVFGSNQFKSTQEISLEVLEQQLYGYYSEKQGVKDYQVLTFLDKGEADKMPSSLTLMILFLGAMLLLSGELLIHFYLNRLTRRLNYILDGMKKVTTGDLKLRLNADENGDELDVISEQFNKTCELLDRHIQKSYLAEIEQRNAELEMLQNQINPHFLYNTVEVIRMKAVCNGDSEVAKMLYNMAVIFRNQIRGADVIPFMQEIHGCKQYLELFEFRYQGKFTSIIDCPEEIMKYPIIKFIIQPVLENYFFHGIRGETEGNTITVTAEKKEEAIWIHVMDNGKGMEPELLAQKNQEFLRNDLQAKRSIGLTNVNRRIKAVYGSNFGVQLQASDTGGLHVILKVGLGEELSDEKSHVGGR